MFKKFLSGVLAATMIVSGTSYVNTATAEAAAPKPTYYFNMDKANKNVVAVARKGDTENFTTGNTETGVIPDTKSASKVKLQYKKGKKGKALYLSRTTASFGAELTGLSKMKSGSWTVSFWVKPDQYDVNNATSIFFTGSKIADPKNTKWVSVTHHDDWGDDAAGNPVIWSHSVSNGKENGFPWYCYQNEDGEWHKNIAIKKNTWTHVTLVVDTDDTCEYGTEGEDTYVKSYHAWTFINGKLYGNGTVAKDTMSKSNKFFLGINAWDLSFKGYIDDVKIWNKAIVTSKQIGKKNGIKKAEKVVKSIM